MKVLVSAYCCHPRSGSEQGFAWYWIRRCSLDHEIVVITATEQRAAIEAHRDELGDNVTFEYVPAGGPVSQSGSEHPGERLRQYRWQLRAIRTARRVAREFRPDVAQHVSTGSWRQPSCLCFTDVPVVLGPLAGSERFPRGFVSTLSQHERRTEQLRELLIKLARFDPLVRWSVRRAAVIMTTGPASRALFERWTPSKLVAGTRAFRHPEVELAELDDDVAAVPLRLAWMGRLIPRKGLDLLLTALTDPRLKEVEVDVIGPDPDDSPYRAMVESLEIGDRVHFHGGQPKDRAFALVKRADVFVFTSLQDMMGQTLSEAMQLGMPVVAMDWSGPSELIGDTGGRRVPVSTPELTSAALANALADLLRDPAQLATMGAAAKDRIEYLVDEQRADHERDQVFARAVSRQRSWRRR